MNMKYVNESSPSFIHQSELVDLFSLLVMTAFLVGGAIGYVMNFLAILQWSGGLAMLTGRIVGVLLLPLGAFLGYVG